MPGSPVQSDLDRQILEALETRPVQAIPADFAARMALRAQTLSPARTPLAMPHPRRMPHYGRTAAWASLIVLAALTLYLSPTALVPQSNHSVNPLLLIESILLLQLLALGLWLGSRLFPGEA